MEQVRVPSVISYVRVTAGLFSLLLISLTVLGQKGIRPRPVKELPTTTANLLFQARLAPPEVRIDAILRLIESERIEDEQLRRELLEESLRDIAQVKYRFRRSLVPTKGISVDTQPGYLSYALDLKLDNISLLSRVLKQLVRVDKPRARQIITEFNGSLGIKPVTCEDILIANVGDFYGSVGTVSSSLFSKKEIDQGLRALFISPWLENIESPSEIAPALDLLKDFSSTPIERDMLFAALVRGINKNFKDDRSFTYAMVRGQIVSKVARLSAGLSDPNKDTLRTGFRDFLSKNLAAPRCKENVIGKEQDLPRYIAEANTIFPEKAISLDDVVSTETGGSAKVESYWRSATSRKLAEDLKALRNVQGDQFRTANLKFDDQWHLRAGLFLQDLESWSANDEESEVAVFNQKCVLFRTLVSMVRGDDYEKTVVRSYLQFLDRSSIQRDRFIEWYLHVKYLSESDPKLFDAVGSEFPNPTFHLVSQLRLSKIKS